MSSVTEPFVLFADETRGSSALYSALSPAVAEDRELANMLLEAPPAQRRANLLFASAHDLLLSGTEHPVSRYYPSITDGALPPDEATFDAFRDLCLAHRETLRGKIAARRIQTNDVRRSIGFFPSVQRLSARAPIALVDVGASAGLNLLLDRYRYRYGEQPWVGEPESAVAIECESRGAAVPVGPEPPRVAFRVGLDGNPLDAGDPEDARWLMACVWPEHANRRQLLGAALDIARTEPPRVVRGSAIDDLEAVIDEVPDELAVCLFHSALCPYFTPDECAAFVATIDRLGRRRPLHWLSLEGGSLQSFGADLPFSHLHRPRPDQRPSDIFGLLGYADWADEGRRDRLLARADMHGRWIDWLGESRG